jgi:ribonucleoside-triphosphate reductase (formate)
MAEKGEDELMLGDAELMVRQSHEDVEVFDPRRIADALIRETGLTPERAQQLAQDVREQIERLGIRNLTSPLIRGLVNAKLIEEGLLDVYRAHSRLGVPFYDAARIIESLPSSDGESPDNQSVDKSRRGSDHPPLHGPEGTSLALAEAIKREYAMLAVFSEKVSFAHLDGDLHIENTGEVDRPQQMICSIDYIKRHGVKLPGGFAGSRAARRPEVLASHLVTWTAALQGYFSEAMTWDSINYAFAPMLVGLNQRGLRQLSQGLLFELSAPTIARGGQPIRCDLHLDWEAPPYIGRLPVVGAAGEKASCGYESLSETARNFLRVFLEIYLEGDAEGRGFTGPRPILHLRPSFFDHPEHRPFLDLVERVMAERGGIVIAFDRDESGVADEVAKEAFTNRYGLAGERLQRTGQDWQWRAAILSSVGLNLPRLWRRAEGDRERLPDLLTGLLELAAQASLEKRIFLEKLLARGEDGSLALLAMRLGGEAFLSLNWSSHAICPIGLAEMVEMFTGAPLVESLDAQELALRVIRHLHDEIDRLSHKHKVRFILGESRDLTATRRLALLDQRKFIRRLPTQSVRGPANDAAAALLPYTSGLKLPHRDRIDLSTRLRLEGLFLQRPIWNGVVNISRTGSHEELTGLIAKIIRGTGWRGISID